MTNARSKLKTLSDAARAAIRDEVLVEIATKLRISELNMSADVVEGMRKHTADLPVRSGLSEFQEPKYTVIGERVAVRATGQVIRDDEPIFIFRAKDNVAVTVLRAYLAEIASGSDHHRAVAARVRDFETFARLYPNRMAWPDTTITELTANHKVRGEDPQVPVWIVNDLGELGVLVNDRYFFMYKGGVIEYGSDHETSAHGLAMHDDREHGYVKWRRVESREFGEVQHPVEWEQYVVQDDDCAPRYTRRGFHNWEPLPAVPAMR